MSRKIVIKWRDARFFPGIYGIDEIVNLKMCVFESLGYLISKNETTTALATEYDNESGYRGIVLIPTGSIISIRRLSRGSFM